MHNLTEKQFTWVCLRARANVEAWEDCQELVVGKGWLGGKKVKGGVSPGEVTTVLAAAGAPVSILTVLLGLVDNLEDRLELAKKELDMMKPVPNKAKDMAYYKSLLDRYFGSNLTFHPGITTFQKNSWKVS